MELVMDHSFVSDVILSQIVIIIILLAYCVIFGGRGEAGQLSQ
jgi:hypothetical protein